VTKILNIKGGKYPKGKVKFLKAGTFPRNFVPREGDITRNSWDTGTKSNRKEN
jgi:hypothetical protein